MLAVHRRSGNVHDSNGAKHFIEYCVGKVKNACPQARIELRMDGAFWRLRKGAKYFEKKISLDCWSIVQQRFLFVRDRQKQQSKGIIQLDLFKPHDFEYRYKVIVTNRTTEAKHVVEYHEGRVFQEGLFAELKTEAALSYVPCNTWNANKLYLLCNVIAHKTSCVVEVQ